MITNFFIPELNNYDFQELWFQKDGATCHTARATIDLLKDTLGDRLISRFGPMNWPPRSCDLTPLDYFLWGYVKSLVYADKPQTFDRLEDNIRRVIADIRPQMLEKIIENWTSRWDYIRASRASLMPEIIFKMAWVREGMDVFKCIAPLRHGGTPNSRHAASPIMRLVFGLSILHIRIVTESPYENNSPRSVPFNTQLSDRHRRLISTTSIKGGKNFSHLWTEECGEVYITGAEESYTRAFGDGPRNFEPWSSDVDDT
ncbi:uncharacterized protein TNCV_57001 [Trichonephila clavipes]|nr:uncharacterized protein TNCV_57001 [Trichonephila clavipes]